MRWCTVTVTDAEGRRHSVDVQATSSFDAAHLFVVEAKKERAVGLPNPTLATVFEVVAAGKIYHVRGAALQRWIIEKRSTWRTQGLYVLPEARTRVAPWPSGRRDGLADCQSVVHRFADAGA